MFGRQARLRVDIIIGLPNLGYQVDTNEFTAQTWANLQPAMEIARRNLGDERSDKQRHVNQTLESYPVFKPGRQVLLYKPHHHGTDVPNSKLLLSPWRGPYTIRAQLSPAMYRVRPSSRGNGDVSLHLAHLKPYREQTQETVPDFTTMDVLFLGKLIPPTALQADTDSLPRVSNPTLLWMDSWDTGEHRADPDRTTTFSTGCGQAGTGR